MKFPNCPICKNEWRDNGTFCWECYMGHTNETDKFPEYVHRKFANHMIAWYAMKKGIVCLVWKGRRGCNEFDEMIFNKAVFPFNTSEEQLEKLSSLSLPINISQEQLEKFLVLL